MFLLWLSVLAGFAGDIETVTVATSPAPAWVRPVEPPLVPDAGRSPVQSAIRYLLVDDQVYLGDGPPRRYSQMVWRIETEAGLDAYSRIEIDRNPAHERIEIHRLEVWRDGEWQDRRAGVGRATVAHEGALSSHIIDGVETELYVLPDVRVGDVVRYAATIVGANPVFGGRARSAFDMAWSEPAGRRFVQVSFPQGGAVWRAHSWPPAPVITHHGGRTWVEWDVQPVAPFLRPMDIPGDVDPWPWVEVSEFQSWSAVVDWALPLYASGMEDPLEVQRAAQALATEGGPEAQATATLRWVQDEVRYFGVELGQGSHAPRPPDLVLERRYGDCKDKTLLYVALLRQQGIRAWPALVSAGAGHSLPTTLPAPHAFDHVIAAVELDGALRYVDPTRRLQGGGASSTWVGDLGHALVLRDGETGLRPLPVVASALPRTRVDHAYVVGPPGTPVQVHMQAWYDGAVADEVRESLADFTPEALSTWYRDGLWRDVGQVRVVQGVVAQDHRDENQVYVQGRFELDQMWLDEPEENRTVFELAAARVAELLPEPHQIDRDVPMALPLREQSEERAVLVVQGDWTPSALQDRVETPWFRYSVDTQIAEVSGQTQATIVWHTEVLADRVAPQDMHAYLDAVDRVWATSVYAVEHQGLSKSDRNNGLWLGLTLLLSGILVGALALLLVLWGRVRALERAAR